MISSLVGILREHAGVRSAIYLGNAVFLLVAGLVGVSCSQLERVVMMPPEIEGATFVGNKTCSNCHTNYARLFPASAHARVHADGLAMKELTGCETCHGPGSKHAAAGGGRGKFIINPGKDPTGCFRCHLETHAEFSLPYPHPVLQGHMNCVQCHDPHGPDIRKPAGGLAMARLNQTCAPCHRDQSRPFIYEHAALREGCATCHHPHGSINPKMLVERDANLCLKCHAQIQGPAVDPGEIYIGKVPHSFFLSQGTCYSAGCHTAVHGSNMSRQLLY